MVAYVEILQLDPSNGCTEVLSQKYEKMRKCLSWSLCYDRERTMHRVMSVLLCWCGRVYLEKMRNQVEAITAFEDVLVEDPESEDALIVE